MSYVPHHKGSSDEAITPYVVYMCMVVGIAVAFGGEEIEMIAPQNQRRSGRTSAASSQGTYVCYF